MILFGASGHGKVIIDAVQSEGLKSVDKVIDDYPKVDLLLGIPVLSSNEVNLKPSDEGIIAIGNNKTRQIIANRLNVNYSTIIHPKAIVANSAKIGKGTVVLANAVINADVIIQEHCIINSSAVIEHDCKLSSFVHVSPNAALAGNVLVGEGTHIGISATVVQGISIGKWVTIGAGAVIIDDIPDYAVVVGIPGKIIKFNPEI
jgi:sugar O-acyltransferase, sialic acid O-acetyltransferase NeuD family